MNSGLRGKGAWAWAGVLLAYGAVSGNEPIPPAADPDLQIPAPTRLESAAATDDAIFASICGCISKRVSIRRDAPGFSPVAWSVRALNGRVLRPREERNAGGVTLDMEAHEPGVYLVSLRDASGRVITRPLRVE